MSPTPVNISYTANGEHYSREPWPHPYLSELPLLHGEKFLTLITETENRETSQNTHHHTLVDNMIKVEMVDPEEAQVLLACANPHDIYPVYPEASLMHLNILVSSSQLQDQDSFDATVYSAKSECPTPLGDCYDSSLTDSNDICDSSSPLLHQTQVLLPQRILPTITDTTHRSQSVNSCTNSIGRNDIRMEEFQDLDVAGLPVLSDPGLESTNAEHELNTPVFEKSNPFDVDLTATVKSLSQSSIMSNNINQQQSTSSNYMFNYVIKEEPISDNSWLDNVNEPSYTINVAGSTSNSNIFSETTASSFLWPSAFKSSSSIGKTFIHEDVTTISDNNLNKIDVLDEFIIRARDNYDEDFNSVYKRECVSSGSSECSVDATTSVPPRLILPDIPNIFASDNNAVNTPDVITTIEEIEADHKRHDSNEFNILQFITEQDIVTSSNIIESFELPVITTTAQTSSPTTTSTTHHFLPEDNADFYHRSRKGSHASKSSYTSSTISKSSRRKRNSYDEDEDYIPPAKKRSTRVTQKPKTLVEYESDLELISTSDIDSSDSDESMAYKSKNKAKTISHKRRSTSQSSTNTNVARRGRPIGSKQSTSTTSAPADKYREMRDKNNEASRKSRLKKKQQDSHFSVEMDDLQRHNIQLKARVSELQKTVDNFRSNLMKVMLNK